MPALRVAWRMATWWQCAILLAFCALFTWPVVAGLREPEQRLWLHLFIPQYALFLYATLSALVNRRSVVVSPEGVVKANGPVPVGAGERILRDDIAFVYVTAQAAGADDGSVVVLFYSTGVVTHAGRHAQVFGEFNDAESAEAAARSIAAALKRDSDSYYMPVKRIGSPPDDPLEQRRILMWVFIIIAGFVVGGAWHFAQR
jgi:hypothetical protein